MVAGLFLGATCFTHVGCVEGRPTGAAVDPSSPAAEGPAAPATDPFEGLLNAERIAVPRSGYSLRLPLGWGEAERAPTGSIELFLVNPASECSIAIRRRAVRIRTYTEWKELTDNFVESLKGSLREPRIERQEMGVLNGAISFEVEHTHLVGGRFYYSRKVCLFGGPFVVSLDFNTPLTSREEGAPQFDAFLGAFELIDRSASRLEQVEPDYAGEYRDPERHLIVPVQRHFFRSDPPGTKHVIARWVLPPTLSVTLAEHRVAPRDLMTYGDFQIGALKEAGNLEVTGGRLDLESRPAYRIEFTTPDAFRSAFLVFDGPDRFYQIVLTADRFSYPYVRNLAAAIVSSTHFE